MSRSAGRFVGLLFVFGLVGAAAGFILAQVSTSGPLPVSGVGQSTTSARGEIVEVLEDGTLQLEGQERSYQVWRVRVTDGERAGEEFTVEYGRLRGRPIEADLAVGDAILLTLSPGPEGSMRATFTDFIRTPGLLLLAATFVVFIVIVSRGKGIRGLLGMVFSFAVIIWFILPQILAGRNPVFVSIVGSLLLMATTLYLVYGWGWKSHTAVLGTFIALIITGLLATFFVDLTHLTGTGSEESLFLQQYLGRPINLQGLLLGAMIIGALGVLDDLTISQVSAVFELKRANPGLTAGSLYRRGMVVGQDHVAATINTLVLAYVGASLPLLLLFSLFAEPISLAVNHSFVAEEIVRTMVGSLGLIAAVPITTGLASLVATRQERLGTWARWLGPVLGRAAGETHLHET